MKRYRCTNCNHILEVEEEKEKGILGKMLKIGGWFVVAAIAINFLAIVIMACLIIAMNSVFESNEVSEKKATCENCKETDFEEIEE